MLTTFLGACSLAPMPHTADNAQWAHQIVTSVAYIASMVNAIWGDKVIVHNLLKSDLDAHSYSLKPSDAATIQKADLFLYNGLGLEPFIGRISQINQNITLVQVTGNRQQAAGNRWQAAEGRQEDVGIDWIDPKKDVETNNDSSEGHVDIEEEHHDHDHEEGNDPHVWLNVDEWKEIAKNILHALITKYPQYTDEFESNYKAFEEKLTQTDQQIQKEFAWVTKQNFLVYHDAYNHFLEKYGLEENKVGVLSHGHDVSISPQELQEISEIIQSKNVKFIITLNQAPEQIIENLAKQYWLSIVSIDPLWNSTDSDWYTNHLLDISSKFLQWFKN